MWTFNCTGVHAPNSHLVQESLVLQPRASMGCCIVMQLPCLPSKFSAIHATVFSSCGDLPHSLVFKEKTKPEGKQEGNS